MSAVVTLKKGEGLSLIHIQMCIRDRTKAVGIRAHSFYPVNAEQIPGKESAANEYRVSVIPVSYTHLVLRDPGRKQTLQEVMKEAIFEKPAEHCFEQVSEMTEHNAMVRIGG